MLNLERRAGQRIYLTLPDGTRGSILVVDARGKIRLGLDFPKNVKIERDDMKQGGEDDPQPLAPR